MVPYIVKKKFKNNILRKLVSNLKTGTNKLVDPLILTL